MILAVFVALIVIFVVLPIVGVALWWVISTVIVGLIVGGLGRLIVPGYNPIGFLPTVACGLIGALIGGAIGRAISHNHFVTILVEIGVGALAVAAWDLSHRRAVGPGGARPVTRGRW